MAHSRSKASHWLVKTEPEAYGYSDLERDGKTAWDGVRNHQAKNNLQAMAVGDQVLIYHSVSDKAVVGEARVSKTAYPDPTAKTGEPWVVVELVPVKRFKKPVPLSEIKTRKGLEEIALVKQARLSVMPLTQAEYDTLVKMGNS